MATSDWNRLMRAVDLAPSILNSKPWKLCLIQYGDIELHADWDQRLEYIDPLHRELFISCGAALFNLRMAIRVTGDDPLVSLFAGEPTNRAAACPHCHALGLLASVVMGDVRKQTTITEQRLYEAIPRRHTVREPFRGVRMNVVYELMRAARVEGVEARLLHPRETRQLLGWTARVDKELEHDQQYLDELSQWTGSGAPAGRGVPAAKFGPKPKSYRRHRPVRDLGLTWNGLRQVKRFEVHPQLIALETTSETPLDWMRTGQALQRLLLTATYYEVQASFLTQQFEVEDRKIAPPSTGHSWRWPKYEEMIIRVGYE